MLKKVLSQLEKHFIKRKDSEMTKLSIQDETVNQPSAAPTNKIAAVGIAGSCSVILVYALGEFGIHMPPEVASAITFLLATGAGYFTKNKVV